MVSAGDEIQTVRFDHAMQDAFRLLVLDGMAERWGSIDDSLNPDLDDIDAHYGTDCVLVAFDGSLIVGTGILVLRGLEGEIVRMSVHREYRRRGIARQLLAESDSSRDREWSQSHRRGDECKVDGGSQPL